MKIVKGIFKLLLSLVLIFLIVGMAVSSFVDTTLLNEDYIKESLEVGGYYEYMEEQIKLNYEGISIAGIPIPDEVIDKLITREQIEEFTRTNVDNIIDFMRYEAEELDIELDTSGIRENLIAYLEEFAEENNIPIISAIMDQVDELSQELSESTRSLVVIFNVESTEGYPELLKVREILNTIKDAMVPMVGAALIVIVLIAVLAGSLIKALPWIGGSMIGSSLVLLVPALTIKFADIAQRVAIESPYIREIVETVLEGYGDYYFTAGLALMATGLVFIVVHIIGRRRLVSEGEEQ